MYDYKITSSNASIWLMNLLDTVFNYAWWVNYVARGFGKMAMIIIELFLMIVVENKSTNVNKEQKG